MLVGFVYIVVCRLFALVLLPRAATARRNSEILVLRHELLILRAAGAAAADRAA